MTTTFHCEIGWVGGVFTDYGPTGENVLTEIDLDPAGGTSVGTAVISLLVPNSSGYDITNRMEVRVYEKTGANITWRWFGGFVSRTKTTRVKGTDYKWFHIDCQDYNVLLDTIVRGAADANTINIAGAQDFDDQVQDLFGALTSGAAAGIEYVSGVENLITSATMGAQAFKGMSLRDMLQALCYEAQRIDPTLRPQFALNTDPTADTTFHGPYLNVWDGATTPGALYHYTDDTGLIGTGIYRAIIEYDRDIESPKLANKRQVVWGATGGVFTANDTTSHAAYPNSYSADGYWWDSPVDAGSDVGSNAEAQAQIDRLVAATAYPRETVEIEVAERVLPGQVVTLTWAPDGIAGEDKRVVGINLTFPLKNNTAYTRTVLTLNNRRLEYYEDGDEGIDQRPTEGDAVPPNAPTAVSFDAGYYDERTGLARHTISWTPSTSTDRAGYNVYAQQGAFHYGPIYVDGPNAAAHDILFYPDHASTSVWVKTVDGHHNESVSSNTYTAATAQSPAGYTVWNPDFEDVDPTAPTRARWWASVFSGAGGTTTLSTIFVNSGLRAYRLFTTTAGNSAAITSHRMIAKKSKAYKLEVWAFTSPVTQSMVVKAYYYQYDGTPSSTPSATLTTASGALTGAWKKFVYLFTTPSDCASFEFEIKNTNGATANVSLYVDTLSVVEQMPNEGIEVGAITGDKFAPTVTLTDQEVQITGTSKVTGAGATMDAGGITLEGKSGGGTHFTLLDNNGDPIGELSSEGTIGGGDAVIHLINMDPDADLDIYGRFVRVGSDNGIQLGTTEFEDHTTHFELGSTPSNPPGGYLRFYPKSDHNLYMLDDTGLETQVNGGGAVANDDRARYMSSTGLNPSVGTPTIVDFDIVDYDPLTLVTTGGAWAFTAATGGTYHVHATLYFTHGNAGDNCELWLYRNGAQYSRLDTREQPSVGGLLVSGSDDIVLVATDYIDIEIVTGGGGGLGLTGTTIENYVAICKIA